MTKLFCSRDRKQPQSRSSPPRAFNFFATSIFAHPQQHPFILYFYRHTTTASHFLLRSCALRIFELLTTSHDPPSPAATREGDSASAL